MTVGAEATSQNPSPWYSARVRLALRISFALLIAIELGLFSLIRSTGWNQTGAILQWGIAWEIVAIPIVIVAAVLVRNRFRLGTRSLLAFMVCAAAFLWVSAIPYWQYQQERAGALLLQQSKVQFRRQALRFSLDQKYLDDIGVDLTHEEPQPPVFWLAPFLKELAKVPSDRSIEEIYLRDDAELRVFLTHHHSFEGLVTLFISDPSEESLAKLKEIAPFHKSLKEINYYTSTGKIASEFWRDVRDMRLPMLGLGFPLTAPQEPYLPTELADWEFLRLLRISKAGKKSSVLHDGDTETLRRCKSLRKLDLFRLEPNPPEQLKAALPNCEVNIYGDL